MRLRTNTSRLLPSAGVLCAKLSNTSSSRRDWSSCPATERVTLRAIPFARKLVPGLLVTVSPFLVVYASVPTMFGHPKLSCPSNSLKSDSFSSPFRLFKSHPLVSLNTWRVFKTLCNPCTAIRYTDRSPVQPFLSQLIDAIVPCCFFVWSVRTSFDPHRLAWLVIPLKWNFDTPWFPYSSWRLFVALCGVPSLVTCIIMALFLPESPKFYQAIGQDEEALKALRYIYTVNKGNSPDKYPVKAIMSDPSQEDVEGDVGTSRSSGVFTSIWKQTAPLFQTPHLRNTVIACLIQLGLYASFNSLLLWLPDLFNRLAVYSSSHPNQTATVCEILSILKKEGDDSLLSPENLTSHATVLTNKSSQLNSNVTSSCVVNIDPIVFQNTLVIGFTSAMAYLLVSQVVNHVNKNKIVAFALAASGLTILGMYFVHTTAEVLPLSCIYVALPGMCVSVLSGIVIDIFPTHLR
uniref:Uncharacterized protein n=1 Tax=Timema cristinae TaxID=61476 RepID=A0A7R9D5S9_TIMCR|nr:unnamed protein product [Timema cristinae]